MRKMHLTSLAVAAVAMVVYPAIADARPGGGARGGARASVGGGGGGGGARSMSRPPPQRQPAAASRGSGGQQVNRQASAANRSGNSVNRSGNTVNRGGNRVNNGNINVGNDVNVNVDNDNGWGWGDRDYHPVAAGVAFGTAAAVTSAAITGARYYSLPPACSPYPYSGLTYYSCGGAYYMPQYEGDNVVYVVVDRPG